MMRWDWQQATFTDDIPPSVIFDRIAADLPGASRIQHLRRGQNGYRKTAVITDTDERHLVTMNYDGNQGAPPNLRATGPDAPPFTDLIRRLGLSHLVTRADACEDLLAVDFHDVAADVRSIARRNGMSGLSYVPDDPERGATYKLGADTSSVKCRVYRKDLEMIRKGCDPIDFPDPIVRVEAELRPRGHALRSAFTTMQPRDVFGGAKWLRAIASNVLDDHPAAFVMQRRQPTDYERQVAWLSTQGGKALSAIYARHPTYEAFGKFMVENVINP